MRKAALPLLLLLASCSYDLQLHPRSGGQVATGHLDHAGSTMTVQLDGGTYSGKVVQGTSTGLALPVGGGMPVLVTAGSNQFSALLQGPRGMLRCDYMLAGVEGGNGVCAQGSDLFDLLIK